SAEVLYELVVPWVALNAANHPEGLRGSVARDAGLLAALLGRSDDAAGHFEDAMAANMRLGAGVWVAHAQYELGRVLGETGRARELFRSALSLSDELGLPVLAERVRAEQG